MEEQKNTPETTVRDNIQDEATDAIVNFIKTIVSHFQTSPEKDKIEELKTILEDIRDSLNKQNQFNEKIYDELISAQKASLRREFINHMIGIHRLMEENLGYIINKMPQDFENNVESQLDKVIELFCFIKDRIVETLVYDYALCEISPSKGEDFNPGEHFVVGTKHTDDESLKNTIDNLVKVGFKDSTNNSIFKRADVITLTYIKENDSDDKNSVDSN